MIDNISEPGSWDKELKRAPWGYGQAQSNQVVGALSSVRAKGLWSEAEILEKEISSLRQELETLRGRK